MNLIAAILKIVLWQFLRYQSNVNSLIRTQAMSLNNMIPLNGSSGNILSHKSQLQKCIEVKYVIFCHFFGRHLELHKKYYNLAV